MKKLISILIVLVMGLGTISLSSCDDEMTAYTLEGTWEGKMYIGYYYGGHEYEASYTVLEFLSDPLSNTSGRGYWVDYYDEFSPYSSFYSRIDWRVDNGTIYIRFNDDYDYYDDYYWGTFNYDIAISDYRLTDNHFRGRIYYDNEYEYFNLVHTSSPHWGYNDWGWRAYGTYGTYGTTRSTADSTEKPVRILRHAAK